MCRNTPATAASSVWSHAIVVISEPRSACSTLRPVAKTVAPALCRPRATPRPTPRLAPVTSATCLVRSGITRSDGFLLGGAMTGTQVLAQHPLERLESALRLPSVPATHGEPALLANGS